MSYRIYATDRLGCRFGYNRTMPNPDTLFPGSVVTTYVRESRHVVNADGVLVPADGEGKKTDPGLGVNGGSDPNDVGPSTVTLTRGDSIFQITITDVT